MSFNAIFLKGRLLLFNFLGVFLRVLFLEHENANINRINNKSGLCILLKYFMLFFSL